MPSRAPRHRHQHHPADFQVEAEDHDRRHGDADAEGDGLARRTGGLDDVVLEHRGRANAKAPEQPEQGQRNHRHRDRGADRQADLEHQIERGRPEDHAQDGAQNDRARRAFPHRRLGGNERVKFRLLGGSGS